MGTFSVTVELGDPKGARWEPVEMLVDSGATFTWVPAPILRRLGVVPQEYRQFEIAGGEVISRGVAQTWIRYGAQGHITFVVFGDDDSAALLGAYALEGFLLGVDPYRERLVPIRALVMSGGVDRGATRNG